MQRWVSQKWFTFIPIVMIALLSPLLSVSLAGATIDTSNRAAVASSYRNDLLPQFSVPNGWTGDVDTCDAGSQSDEYQTATLETINWFREMTGLPPVTLNADYNNEVQEAALLMSANGALNHSPPSTWDCWTPEGSAGASSSNLSAGNTGPAAIFSQVRDAGTSNTAAGHRRWILCPTSQYFASGSTFNASALKVFGGNEQRGLRASSPDWVTWPPEGNVPYQTVFDRWSLSFNASPGADFSNATVTMTEDGQAVSNTIEPLSFGFCDNTLVWVPDLSFANGDPDRTITVTVSNIVISGEATTHSYDVTVIDSSEPADDSTCNGLEVTVDIAAGQSPTPGHDVILGTSGPDVINGLSGFDTICGRGGNDTINGGLGDDVILGDAGNDTINGAAGNDFIEGGLGDDTIQGAAGDDFIDGGTGDDDLFGSDGSDVIRGGDGDDFLASHSGADVVFGDAGQDRIIGGPGNDELRGGDGDDAIVGSAGDDLIFGEAGLDVIQGNFGVDRMWGGDGNDRLRGGPDADFLRGENGNDLLLGNGGNDSVQGQAGDDFVAGGTGIDGCNGGLGNDRAHDTCETVNLVP